jgi:hypothetical protein
MGNEEVTSLAALSSDFELILKSSSAPEWSFHSKALST